MCTTSALQNAITTDKLNVARVRFRQGTDESPLILNHELMKVESRLGSGITRVTKTHELRRTLTEKGPEIGRSFLAHMVHDAGLVVVSDKNSEFKPNRFALSHQG